MAIKCVKALISGRVQGVFFRDSTRTQASQLGITGHAINLADGRVEVIACGESSQLNLLIDWLNKGPVYADVSDVHITHLSITPPNGFTIG